MKYTVMQGFHDRKQGGKYVKAGTSYPPDGVNVSDEWLAYLAGYRYRGKPILKGDAPKQKAGKEAEAPKAKKD